MYFVGKLYTIARAPCMVVMTTMYIGSPSTVTIFIASVIIVNLLISYLAQSYFATPYHNCASIHFVYRQLMVLQALGHGNSIDLFCQQDIYRCACTLKGCYNNNLHW
jgi:hypothetical protein